MVNHISELLEEAPTNWGRWGEDDELGAINYLDSNAILQGIKTVEYGDSYALGTAIGHPGGDPITPDGEQNSHYMTLDEGHYQKGLTDSAPEGHKWTADIIRIPVHGTSTHVDSLAHVWYDDKLYNGFNADTTIHGLDRCGIENVADHSIIGRGVLLDIARYRGVNYLSAGEPITLDEIYACADYQGVEVQKRDILLLRTGVIELFYDKGSAAYETEYIKRTEGTAQIHEPGPTYSESLIKWIDEREIPMLGTDTLTGEQTVSEETGIRNPLHPALLRNLGVLLGELHYLSDLAAACAADGRYAFMYICSPLNIIGGTGSPVNPIAIR